MATRKLLLWFEKRRMSKTMNLVQQQITKTIESVKELEQVITAFSKDERKEVKSSLQKLFSQEVEIDNIRRTLFEELITSEIPPKYREDLKGLTEHLDILADHVKDSARSVEVLIETTVPKAILDGYVTIAKKLSECASVLSECIEMLGIDPSKTKELASQVDSIEDKIDDDYVKMKSLFMKYSKDLDTAILMEVRDLLDHLEATADLCADTADHIRTLAAEETSL